MDTTAKEAGGEKVGPAADHPVAGSVHTATYFPSPPFPDSYFGGAYVMLNALSAQGITEIYGLPGGAIAELTTAMARQKKIKFILARHEQGAGFMAYGAAKMTKKAAVVTSTQGPGACNLVNVAASATEDRVPLVLLIGNVSMQNRHRRAFQNIDTQKLFEPVTKWSVSIRDVKNIPEVVYEAFKRAHTWPYGAVHIEFPKNVAATQVDPRDYGAIPPALVTNPGCAYSPSLLDEAWDRIKSSQRPIIIVGPELCSLTGEKEARNELRRFCDRTNIGCVMMPGGKGAILSSKDYCLYTLSMIYMDYANLAINDADLVIAVGYDRGECDVGAWSSPSIAAKIIHISLSEAIVDRLYQPFIQLVGDISQTLTGLNARLDAMPPMTPWQVSSQKAARDKVIQSINYNNDESHGYVYPERVCRDIQRASEWLRGEGKRLTLVLDSGGHQLWALRNWQCDSFSEVLSSNTFASMGIGLPAAVGAAQAVATSGKAFKRKLVCLFGDGGWIMNLQELETATRLNLDLVVIIWINNSLGLVEWGDLTDFGDRMDFKFGNPEVTKLASSFGWRGVDVRDSEDFFPALQHALKTGGRSLIYVHVDSSSDLAFSDTLVRDCILQPSKGSHQETETIKCQR